MNNPSASAATQATQVAAVHGLLKAFNALALSQMVPMQFDVNQTTYQSFKSISTVKTVPASGAVTVAVPTTATEALAGTAVPTVTLTNVAAGSVKVGLVETKAQYVANTLSAGHSRRALGLAAVGTVVVTSGAQSNLLHVTLPSPSACSGGACNFTVTLPVQTTVTYSSGQAAAAVFTTVCASGVANTVTNTCPDGSTVTATCDGGAMAYRLKQSCAYTVIAPSCARVVASSGAALTTATDVCTTTAFTSSSTTCACSVRASVLARDYASATVAGSVQLVSVTTNSVQALNQRTDISVPPSASPTQEGWASPTAAPSTIAPSGNPSTSPSVAPSAAKPSAVPSFAPVAANATVVYVQATQTIQGAGAYGAPCVTLVFVILSPAPCFCVLLFPQA